MRSALSKLLLLCGVLAIFLALVAMHNAGTPLRAGDCPDWPDTEESSSAACFGSGTCVICPKDQTVVYGADKAQPSSEYVQGSCQPGYPGATHLCYCTYWGCKKIQCKNGQADDPPKYYYKGNWCYAP
jgi:hypothetical protein